MDGMFMGQNELDKNDIGDLGVATVYKELLKMGYNPIVINESFTIYKYMEKDVSRDKFFGLDMTVKIGSRDIGIQVKTKQPRGCGNDTGLEAYQLGRLYRRDKESESPYVILLFVERKKLDDDKLSMDNVTTIYGGWIRDLVKIMWENKLKHEGTKLKKPNKNLPCGAWNGRDKRWMVYWRKKDLQPFDRLITMIDEFE